MKRHWAYFKYLMKHKWYVFVASRIVGLNLFRAIIHDWHKFLPDEWFGYIKTFYCKDYIRKYNEFDTDLEYSWNRHQKRAKHHWQYWVLIRNEGELKALRVPRKYVLEMVADWMGAGRAIKGKWDIGEWYQKYKDTMIIHKETTKEIEKILKESLIKLKISDIL